MNTIVAQYKEQGNDCMKKQDYSAAIIFYMKGLAIEPNNPILNCNVSQAYLNLKDFSEAEKYAKIAIELQNDYTKAYFRAAKAAHERHDVYECMLYLAKGVQNCVGENLEDLFVMARELSDVFELALRSQAKSSKKEVKNQDGACKTVGGNLKGVDSKEENKKIPSIVRSHVVEKNKKDSEKEHEVKDVESKKKEFDLELKKRVKDREEVEKKQTSLKEYEKSEKEAKELDKKKKEEVIGKPKLKDKARNVSASVDLHSQMKEGSMALLKGLHRKAVDCFRKASDVINSHKSPHDLGLDNMDMVILSLALSQSLILSDEYKDVVKGIKMLETLEEDGKHTKLPVIFLFLGRAFLRLNRFEHARLPLERGLHFLSRGTAFSRYSWPGTFDVINFTDRDILKKALEEDFKESKIYHKPDCICCYEKCHSTSQHILPSKYIFFSDLDFVGYVSLECQGGCLTYFHVSCWKHFKETLSNFVKLSEKDILGRNCLTPDCLNKYGMSSVIIKVSITGPDGEEKSTCKLNPIHATHTILKETSKPIEKSPRKKSLKKKVVDKIVRHPEKKLKVDSKIKSSLLNVTGEVVASSNVDRLGDAIQKLELARENNFGYDDCLHDPRLSYPIPSSIKAGRNEEFIFTFFQEIFKKDGFMPVATLREHWEANKEILPDIQPALITFTDLARFLVDSKIFAIVHDTIGLASDLPDMYAIVQAKSIIPTFKTEKSWQPSKATSFEVQNCLNLASPLSTDPIINLVDDYPKSENKAETYHQESSGTYASYDSALCLGSASSEASSSSSTNVEQSSDSEKVEAPFYRKEPLYLINGHIEESEVKPQVNEVFHETGTQNEAIIPHYHENHIEMNLPNGLPQTEADSGKDIKLELRNSIAHKKVSWKPRAKLLEWATAMFPHESQATLWKALTLVRSQNNNTLSQLSFDAIGSRVQDVLGKLNNENELF